MSGLDVGTHLATVIICKPGHLRSDGLGLFFCSGENSKKGKLWANEYLKGVGDHLVCSHWMF